MYAEIETLLKLQECDQKIRGLRKQLDRIPGEEEAAKERLRGDERAVDQSRSAIQENEVEMKNIELDIETRKESVARLKVQQFETKKNEEYRAMGCEIERYEKEVGELEDRELEFMEAGEELKKKMEEACSALEATQSLVDEELGDLAARRDKINGELAGLEEEHAKIIVDLDEDTVEIYERLMDNKGDVAVVPLVDSQCTGCHVKVVSDTVVQAKGGKALTHCENCGRIVYIEA